MQSPANPLLRAVSILIGAIMFVAALFFGAIVLAFIIGFVVIVVAIGAVRLWWIRRKIERAAAGSAQRAEPASRGRSPRGQSPTGRVIEGEFAEIRKSSDARRSERTDSDG